MNGHSGWSWRPFRPIIDQNTTLLPYVVRLAPSLNGVDAQIIDNGAPSASHVLYIRLKDGQDQPVAVVFEGDEVRVENLMPDQDYELWIARADDEKAKSPVRYARTGFYPDTIVNYIHPEDQTYLFSGYSPASPSMVKLPSGAILTSLDVYKGGFPQNLSMVFRSDDEGKTWRWQCDVYPCFWGTLFLHRGRLYLLGLSTEYGDVLIAESRDEGRSWNTPVPLFRGSITGNGAGPQRAPMPVLESHGRLMTNIEFGSWKVMGNFVNGVLSVNADADLLVPENWTFSQCIPYDPAWAGSPDPEHGSMIEGSLVEAPDGRVLNILRLNVPGTSGVAVALKINPDDPEAAPEFDSFVSLPSGVNSKTCIRQDPADGRYWAIGNLIDSNPRQRNILALQVSEDLVSWRVAKILLDYRQLPDGKTGFQYPDFLFDGDDIIYLSRTAFNGAASFHDGNCQTFGRVSNFRIL